MVGISYRADFIQTPLPSLAATLLIGSVLSLFFGILAEILVRVHFKSRGVRPYAVEAILDSEADVPGQRDGLGRAIGTKA